MGDPVRRRCCHEEDPDVLDQFGAKWTTSSFTRATLVSQPEPSERAPTHGTRHAPLAVRRTRTPATVACIGDAALMAVRHDQSRPDTGTLTETLPVESGKPLNAPDLTSGHVVIQIGPLQPRPSPDPISIALRAGPPTEWAKSHCWSKIPTLRRPVEWTLIWRGPDPGLATVSPPE